MSMLKILCVGQEWRGSNASGLFYALSRIGCAVSIINDHHYISLSSVSAGLKIMERLIRPWQVREYNKRLISETQLFKPHLVLVYKGPFVEPETILSWKNLSIPVVNFFPDVSFMSHGKRIPRCIAYYDFIFTTKSFGSNDLHRNFGIPHTKVHYVPHGFDPLIHRKIEDPQSLFRCDVSFIGTYSLHKEDYLLCLKKNLPSLDLKIWGNWLRSRTTILKSSIQGDGVFGDLYALAINSSKINIALLSEEVLGASSGDKITSRTFHIPASGGFMLHQRTDELLSYFEEDNEVVCFDSSEELIDKVSYYLKNEHVRQRISANGYDRAQREHSLDARARELITVLQTKLIIGKNGL
jgi:spore maturation protein CgeB